MLPLKESNLKGEGDSVVQHTESVSSSEETIATSDDIKAMLDCFQQLDAVIEHEKATYRSLQLADTMPKPESINIAEHEEFVNYLLQLDDTMPKPESGSNSSDQQKNVDISFDSYLIDSPFPQFRLLTVDNPLVLSAVVETLLTITAIDVVHS